ncbi:hypothetical protein GCM10023093_13410 [Nemorincola caseinilytica]|uniref:Lipoprotein n=1 Tax=Nemorincola caseinilytica TaxID=2054315 RepID=A0ABP8NDD4_9BACT
MRKVLLFLLAVGAVVASCHKNAPKEPVSYSVETAQNKPISDIYIPDQGAYKLSLLVKYLGGFSRDSVTISITGLPADVQLVEDTFRRLPTFVADFVFLTTNAAHKTYPITITTTAPGTTPKVQTINLTVISADCASVLQGTYSGANGCTNRNVTYTATAATTGAANELDITNLGGYGSATSTHMIINCAKDSVYIPQQHIGNGTNLSGAGTISGNTITITYTASTTPLGFAETCVATLTKQ